MEAPKQNVLEANTPFEESSIWQINRSYYEEEGLAAWSDGVVPHNMTSNSTIGKTYAGLILGFLKDRLTEEATDEDLLIIELGSGHGRLAYHILKHLDKMIALEPSALPSFCYVLTDIAESNLSFFEKHPQLQEYFDNGKLDVSYYDGIASSELYLRKQKKTIVKNSLQAPIIAIANYFFDSIPNQLYHIKEQQLFSCGLSLASNENKENTRSAQLLENIQSTIHVDSKAHVNEKGSSTYTLLEDYKLKLKNTFLLIPRLGFHCIETLKSYSKNGLLLIALDKGYSDISKMENLPQPQIILHGSFSLYVNFHALIQYCNSCNGKTMFSAFSDYSMQLGCFLFTDEPQKFHNTIQAHDQFVNDFGPDDFDGLKKLFYRLLDELSLRELITILRLSNYDSNFFVKSLPHIRKHLSHLNIHDRKRLRQILLEVDDYYFDINESSNVSFEIGGLLYDMAFYQDSLDVFNSQTMSFGESPDIYYNKILCYYQLRKDDDFTNTLEEAKKNFPGYEKFLHLDKLDLEAK